MNDYNITLCGKIFHVHSIYVKRKENIHIATIFWETIHSNGNCVNRISRFISNCVHTTLA